MCSTRLEREFDYSGEIRFKDLETGEQLTTQPRHIRDEYRKRYAGDLSLLVQGMHENQVDYAALATDVPFDRALTEYLSKRKRLF